KDISGSAGEDKVWLDDIAFPGGVTEGFEGATFPPTGWTTGGYAHWTVCTQPDLVRGTGTKSAQSGQIGDSQYTYLQVTKTISAGTLTFFSWTSTEYRYDVLKVYVDGVLKGTDPGGVNSFTVGLDYPATHPDVLGIGASTDFDYRADFSQYGSALELVAPGGGGLAGIYTTDRTGLDGEASGDYDGEFAGTSAS